MPWKILASFRNDYGMDKTPTIASIGQAAAWLQRSPARIEQAARDLGIEPALILNRIPHFSEADLDRIARHFQTTGDASGPNAARPAGWLSTR